MRAASESLKRLKLEYVDLYLIHWPSPRRGLYVETWRAMIALREQGLVRSIGVSNFNAEHLQRILGETGVTPALNQVELHPRFQQKALREFHASHGIATKSWAPLGRAQLLGDPVIAGIAAKHTAARRRRPSSAGISTRGSLQFQRRRGASVWRKISTCSVSRSTPRTAPPSPRSTARTDRMGPDPMTASF